MIKDAKAILIVIFASTFIAFGQTIEFKKKKKNPIIFRKYYSAIFKLKDGTLYKGQIDTLTEKEIFVKLKDGGHQSIIPDNIESVKTCGYLLLWGARGHFGRHCKKTNLTDYKYTYKSKK